MALPVILKFATNSEYTQDISTAVYISYKTLVELADISIAKEEISPLYSMGGHGCKKITST